MGKKDEEINAAKKIRNENNEDKKSTFWIDLRKS